MELSFKKCNQDNLKELRQLSISTFSRAFKEQNNPEDFESYLAHAFSQEQLLMEIKNPHSSFFFTKSENTVVGYLKINRASAQTELQEASGLELERIYVSENCQNRGIGGRMLSFAEALAKEEGKTYLWLGVWEQNTMAITFYERNGYKKFGKHPYYIGTDKQTDWLLKKAIQ